MYRIWRIGVLGLVGAPPNGSRVTRIEHGGYSKMPALSNIHQRIAVDQQWEQAYNRNLDRSRLAAERVQLVHVTSAAVILTILSSGVPELLPYDVVVQRERNSHRLTDPNHDMEGDEKQHEPSKDLHLFAGRAWPGIGDVAIAFTEEFEDSHEGEATPFDTGGLAKGRIKWNPTRYSGNVQEFVNESTVPLGEWRRKFGVFMAAYFSDYSEYWSGRPCFEDPEQIFLASNNNHWRAWTFEIRLKGGHNVCERWAWSCDKNLADLINARMIEGLGEGPTLGGPDEVSPLVRFAQSSGSLTPGGSEQFREVLENWIRSELEKRMWAGM